MKKYQAKHHPVTGAPQTGDRYVDMFDNVFFLNMQTRQYVGHTAEEYVSEPPVLVYNYPDSRFKHVTLCLFDINDKLLGRISPQAMWVKAGDIFTEDRIQPSNEVKELDGSFRWTRDVVLCYKIKCSTCGTFH